MSIDPTWETPQNWCYYGYDPCDNDYFGEDNRQADNIFACEGQEISKTKFCPQYDLCSKILEEADDREPS